MVRSTFCLYNSYTFIYTVRSLFYWPWIDALYEAYSIEAKMKEKKKPVEHTVESHTTNSIQFNSNQFKPRVCVCIRNLWIEREHIRTHKRVHSTFFRILLWNSTLAMVLFFYFKTDHNDTLFLQWTKNQSYILPFRKQHDGYAIIARISSVYFE